jgi:hypothetical protein
VSNNQEEEKASSTSSLETTIISKPAKTDHPINELMAKRWSARAFSSRPVEREKLLSVLEAGRWAPSSRNEQPWRYIVFTNDNPEKLKKAQSVLKDINNYAKRAPILICAITKKTYSDNTNFNRLHFHDLGAANENMFLEAFNQGLIMHEMGGFDVQKAREVFNIPDDFEVKFKTKSTLTKGEKTSVRNCILRRVRKWYNIDTQTSSCGLWWKAVTRILINNDGDYVHVVK